MSYNIYNFKSGLLIYVISVLLSSSSCLASDSKSGITIGNKDIEAMIEKAEPLIKEVTGRTFKKRMKHKIVDRAELYDTLLKGGSSFFRKNLKNFDNETITRQIETEAGSKSHGVLGLYLTREKIFYITPGNIEFAMKTYQVKTENYNDFVFLIIVHEMVHALDDQYFNLRKLYRSTKNSEEAKALNSLIEGNAVYLTEVIADKLNIPESIRTFSKKITSRLSEAQKINSQQYIRGYEFIDAIINKNGKTAVEAAFIKPPVSTVQILNLEDYLRPANRFTINYSKLLKRVTKDITPESMKEQRMAIGAMDLNKYLLSNGITRDEASMIARDCLTGSGYRAVKPVAKPRSISIEIYNFREINTASKLKEINFRIQESKANQAKASLSTKLDILKEETIELAGYDHVMFRETELKKAKAVTKSIEVTGLMGCNYISLKYENMEDITPNDAINVLNLIYSEYLKMK